MSAKGEEIEALMQRLSDVNDAMSRHVHGAQGGPRVRSAVC